MIKAKPELLAPAGDMDCLKAAIAAGADAVYFGTDLLNARIRAKNFTLESVDEAVFLCHAYDVKAYVTLNTAVYEREMETVFSYVLSLIKSGVDAFIVSDLGVIKELRERYPDIELHASTQCTVHNSDGADFLYGLGCARVVCARELDKESIKNLCQGKAEIEMFVHGAHCMSFSGQCLMSFAMGGRSGNRGECAQPCRLPYRISGKEGYFLSLKDMSLSGHVREILNIGVSSLKIEGRMKSPEYVYTAVSTWRKLIDGKRDATRAELSTLAGAFSRQGFTDGYFEGKIDSSMLGVRTQKDKEITKKAECKIPELEKIGVSVSAVFKEGEHAKITLCDGKNSVTCIGDMVETAINSPMSEDDIRKNLIKFGNTPYYAKNIHIEKTDNVIIKVSALNALRRKASRALADKCVNPCEKRTYKGSDRKSGNSPKETPKHTVTAVFSDPDTIPEQNPFDICFVYADRYKNGCRANGVYLPPVILDREWGSIEMYLKAAWEDGVRYALVSNVGQIERVKKMGFKMIADFRFNIFNPSCVDILKESGFENVILSPELSLAQMNSMKGCISIVYGKIPVMTTYKCIIKDTAGCEKCKTYLVDRTNASFFVEGIFGHRNVIYNSVPIYMADKMDVLKNFSHHFIFTNESKDECTRIMNAYKNGYAPDGKIRRIKP